MKKSIKIELAHHILDLINDGVLTNDNSDDWGYHAFNEVYYIIGSYNAEKWLEKHDIGAFEAIKYVMEQELANFGEVQLKAQDINAEAIVNLYVYFLKDEIFPSGVETVDELKEAMQEIITNNIGV